MARFLQDPYAGHTTAVNIPQCREIYTHSTNSLKKIRF